MIQTLVEAGLRALVLAISVSAGLRILRVSNVLVQKICWGLVLLAAFLMPAIVRWNWIPELAAIRVHLPIKTEKSQSYSPPALAVDRALEAQQSAPSPNYQPAVAADRFPAPTVSQGRFEAAQAGTPHVVSEQSKVPAAQKFAAALWVGSLSTPARSAWIVALLIWAALLARLIVGVFTAIRLWLTAAPIQSCAPDDLGPRVKVRASTSVFSPVTIGSGILLPSNYSEWDDEKLRIVLAHERSHIRQGDFYLQLLSEFYAALFWFSPLGWWLKRKLSDLGEAISDRAALEEATSPASYAEILLEFAAMPRPAHIGVAMARKSNLSSRIEHVLNDSKFIQAFAMSRRGLIIAALLVPAALFAATALIRVEAASQESGQAPPQAPAAIQPAPPQAPEAAPAIPGSTQQEPLPAPPASPAAVEKTPPAPPAPPAVVLQTDTAGVAPIPPSSLSMTKHGIYATAQSSSSTGNGHGYSYSYSSNGDSYALVGDSTSHITFSGDWNGASRATLDKARQQAHGKFLWFTHDGKSYFIDDQATIDQIEAMYKPMEALGRQQEELGRQQEALGKQQEELGRQQEQASIPAPDLSKEMAELNAAMAKLQSMKGASVSREQLADLQGKIGEIQGRLGELQGEFGEKQGSFGEMQGKLGEQQGKLGAEQGKLGAEQGRMAAEADRKIKAIINQSLGDGKAKPLE